MTLSDVPPAGATHGRFADSPRVSTDARVRVPATFRDHKIARVAVLVRADGRRWWLLAGRPASLRAWHRSLRPALTRVPDGSARLRRLWMVHNYTLGVVAVGVSNVLYLVAGLFRWLACHPARLWGFLLLAGVLVTAVVVL